LLESEHRQGIFDLARIDATSLLKRRLNANDINALDNIIDIMGRQTHLQKCFKVRELSLSVIVDLPSRSENILRHGLERFLSWGGFSSTARIGLDWPIAVELLSVLTC